MKRSNRYLLFYAILAFGLALSWSQVSRRAQQQYPSPVSVLQAEEDCLVRLQPCAAYATDFALVLGPSPEGFRLVGEKLPSGLNIEASFLDPQGDELRSVQAHPIQAQNWSIEDVPEAFSVRLTMTLAERLWQTAFNLDERAYLSE